MIPSLKYTSLAVALLSLGFAMHAPAAAQGADALLEEIVVTSQRREQSLQEVPSAVTAISSDALELKQIDNLLDLQYAVPNLSLAANTGTANGARIFLRGVGEDESRVSADPAIAVYVDGIYVGRQVGALFDLVDLQRVEVLRGPQGTLYGRNSNGGAIRLVSKAPDVTQSTAKIGLTLGSEDRFDVKANANLVLGSNTALRTSFLSRKRDGFHSLNPNGDFAGTGGNVGQLDTLAFRAALAHDFGDLFSATLILDATNDESDPVPDSAAPGHDADGDLFTIEPLPGTVCSALTPANFMPMGCFREYQSDVRVRGVSLRLSGAIGAFEWASLTGYRSMQDELVSRIGFPYIQDTDQDQFSQELTLTSQFDSAFNFVAGIFVFTEDAQLDSVFVAPFSLGVETEAMAVFFQSTYDVSASTTLTTGIRYTDETKDVDAMSFLTIGRQESVDFNNATYTLSLDRQFSESLMGYVSYATGFKSGGWSPDCFAATACFLPVDEETLDSLEFGIRAELLGNRLRLNATYFFNSYEGLQIGATVPDLGFTRFNTKETEIDGLEVELLLNITEQLAINATFGTLNGEYTDLTESQAGGLSNNGASPGCGGTPSIACAMDLNLKNAPDYKGTLGATYRVPMRSGTLTASVDVSFEDDSFSLVANDPPHALTDPGTLFDARLVWEADSDWRLALWGKNLADEEYARASTARSFSQYAAAPRTWGLDVSYSF